MTRAQVLFCAIDVRAVGANLQAGARPTRTFFRHQHESSQRMQ